MRPIELIRVSLVRDADSPTDERTAISRPADVLGWLAEIRTRDREQLCCLHLDARNNVNALEIVSTGSLNASLVHPREVMKAAILNTAASIILAHNYPSDYPTPSREDIELTRRMVNVGEIIGTEVLDHIIVGPERFLSMKEANLLCHTTGG